MRTQQNSSMHGLGAIGTRTRIRMMMSLPSPVQCHRQSQNLCSPRQLRQCLLQQQWFRHQSPQRPSSQSQQLRQRLLRHHHRSPPLSSPRQQPPNHRLKCSNPRMTTGAVRALAVITALTSRLPASATASAVSRRPRTASLQAPGGPVRPGHCMRGREPSVRTRARAGLRRRMRPRRRPPSARLRLGQRRRRRGR